MQWEPAIFYDENGDIDEKAQIIYLVKDQIREKSLKITSHTYCSFSPCLLGQSYKFVVYAQNKKTQDRNAIKKMCGCFEVEFNFAETFKYSSDSTYVPSNNYRTAGLEWAQQVDDENNKISIQHILLQINMDQ